MSADETSGILADLLAESEREREEERKSRVALGEKIDVLVNKVATLSSELATLQEAANAMPFATSVKIGKYRFHIDVRKRDTQERISAADISISEAT